MTTRVRSDSPHRLIVEGRNDLYPIVELMTKHGWNWEKPDSHAPYVQNAGGLPGLLESVPVSIRTCQRLGVVVDMDQEPLSRWAAVSNRLREEGVEVPDSPDAEGLVAHMGTKWIGVWLMPDNRTTGAIEDFLSRLIPANDTLWPWALTATEGARSRGAFFRGGSVA